MKTALVMSVVLAILVVGVMLVLTFVQRFDPESVQTQKMYYFTAENIHVNWSVARQECRRLVPGALLATIDTAEEGERFLQTVVQGHPEYVEPRRLYWLDGTDLEERGRWVWGSTGQVVEGFLEWEPPSPLTADDEDKRCLAAVVGTNSHASSWTSVRCEDVAGFVCQYYDLATS